MIRQIIGLIVSIGICFAVAGLSSRYMPAEWYRLLQKPSWTPPNYLFGPVWTFLYASMGVAAWLVWKQAGFSGAGLALGLFFGQLVLNGLWTWIFFGLQKPGLAFADIAILWAMILATMIAFWQKQPVAGMLFIPYLAWVSYASALNYAIWRLNRLG
jgi:benzodiazapine receptor